MSDLSESEKEHFFVNGYIIKRNVIPKEKVDAALRLINKELGQGLEKEEMKKAQNGTFCPRIVNSPEIRNLFSGTDVSTLVGKLLGKNCPPVWAGQVALRFPGTLCVPNTFSPVPFWNKIFHIDGFHSKDNGIQKGQIKNFTCLVGIYLTDVSQEFSGNLVVYPRSHHVLEKYFRENGFEIARENGLEKLPYLPISSPVQILAKAGDIVLAHYQLAHSIAPNTSPHVRYAVYFRVNMQAEGQHHPEPMLNIWTDYFGLKDTVQRFQGQSFVPQLKSGEGLKPSYADEMARADLLAFSKRDAELAQIRQQADELFGKHDWKAAQPLFKMLADERPDEWEAQLKVACCFTFSPVQQDVPKAEVYLNRTIQLSPVTPNGYVLMMQNLGRQQRYADAYPYIEKLMNCGATDDVKVWVDGFKTILEILVRVNRDSELPDLIQRAKDIQPKAAPELDKLLGEAEVEKLWVKGKEWIHSPQKNLVYGYELFGKIAKLRPTDYWAHVLAGGCYTWTGQLQLGEPYLRQAIQIDPNVPHGYSILSQNLLNGGKRDEAFAIAFHALVDYTFPTVSQDPDHAEKVIEILTVIAKVLGKTNSQFIELANTTKQKYPNLIPKIDKLLQDPGCIQS
jgi:tetratricopeptide (TPR) repeat protein